MRAKELLTLARRDEGMAILGAICSVLVLLSMLLAATTCADLLAARQRAAAAADVAALAAAPDAALSPEDACVRAREIASRNDALLISCQVQNEEVVVRAVASPRTNWARWIEHVVSDSTDPSVSARATMSESASP